MVAIGGGWVALRLTGSLNWLFAALALGLIVYGVTLTQVVTRNPLVVAANPVVPIVTEKLGPKNHPPLLKLQQVADRLEPAIHDLYRRSYQERGLIESEL
jgi:hypothetical protein